MLFIGLTSDMRNHLGVMFPPTETMGLVYTCPQTPFLFRESQFSVPKTQAAAMRNGKWETGKGNSAAPLVNAAAHIIGKPQ